jgi:hypothetical protein
MKLADRRLDRFALLVGMCLLFVPGMRSQTATTVQGKVLDQSGANIPGATVTVFSDDRVLTTKTDDLDGSFIVSGLGAPARFLDVAATGFSSASVLIAGKPTDDLLIVLSVGRCTQCGPLIDIRNRFVTKSDLVENN